MLRKTASSACGAARTSCIQGLCVGATLWMAKSRKKSPKKMRICFAQVWPEARAYQAQEKGSTFNC